MPSTITKRVDRAVPRHLRHQTWKIPTDDPNNDDGTAITNGDIIDVEASLGKTADTVLIEVDTGDLKITLNPLVTIYPPYHKNHFFPESNLFYDLLASGVTVSGTNGDPMTVNAGEVLELDHSIPVKQIELSTVTGVTFSITVM